MWTRLGSTAPHPTPGGPPPTRRRRRPSQHAPGCRPPWPGKPTPAGPTLRCTAGRQARPPPPPRQAHAERPAGRPRHGAAGAAAGRGR
eukprot:scaffold33632_cov135-Isochrysis_galbana.AAC.4